VSLKGRSDPVGGSDRCLVVQLLTGASDPGDTGAALMICQGSFLRLSSQIE
jgi:hypothetical protein